MSLMPKSYRREILIFLTFWILIAVLLFSFFRRHYQKNYSEGLYEALLTTVSTSRPLVSDPCLYSIFGDPPTAESNFAKVFLFCGQEERSANSFHLVVLKHDSYADMLTELGRINSFRVTFPIPGRVGLGDDQKQTDTSWKCFSDHERITDFSQKVKRKARIECFFNYSDSQIQKLYE